MTSAQWNQMAAKGTQNANDNDPYEGLFDNGSAIEKAVRHTFDPTRKEWLKRTIQVKLLDESFAEGCMRRAYQAKVTDTSDKQWNAAKNVVLKEYMDPVPNETYYSDVMTQADAKMYAEAFNMYNPKRKIDFLQLTILEFTERDFKPCYHMEAFIEGDYEKHSSNAGYVNPVSEEGVSRRTPHAFSHFTYVKSDYKKIVVDIQGVQDIFTDPQIHSFDGEGYGDGNLGIRGIALFFLSHRCNEYCKFLKLPEVKLHPLEITEEMTMAIQGTISDMTSALTMKRRTTGTLPPIEQTNWAPSEDKGSKSKSSDPNKIESSVPKPRSSQVEKLPIQTREPKLNPIASVHYGIADLYCSGWYMDMVNEAALFHLEIAAKELKSLKALAILGTKLLGQETDELEDLEIPKDVNAGWALIEEAALLGDKNCIWKMAQRYHFGQHKDFDKALQWYNFLYDQGVNTPLIRYHMIIAQIGDIHLKGGNNLKSLRSERFEIAANMYQLAADDAKRDGRVRQAQKYLGLVEEAFEKME